MTLGCAFIFVVILWLCRRKAKKRRAKRTAAFASSKGLDQKHNWRRRLVHFGEKLFGHSKNRRVLVRHPNEREGESVKLAELGDAEEARSSSDGLLKDDDDDMVQLIGSYQRRSASPRGVRFDSSHRISGDDVRSLNINSHAAPSIFSQMTGSARRAPDARQPVKELTSRFSDSTTTSSFDNRGKSLGYKSNNPFVQ